MAVCILLAATAQIMMNRLAAASPQTLPPPTLLVINDGPHDFAVMLQGQGIGKAPAGSRTCFQLRKLDPAGPHHLALRALSTGFVILAPIEYFPRSRGWRLTIGQHPSLQINSLETAAACS